MRGRRRSKALALPLVVSLTGMEDKAPCRAPCSPAATLVDRGTPTARSAAAATGMRIAASSAAAASRMRIAANSAAATAGMRNYEQVTRIMVA